jgi:hypothetical protein
MDEAQSDTAPQRTAGHASENDCGRHAIEHRGPIVVDRAQDRQGHADTSPRANSVPGDPIRQILTDAPRLVQPLLDLPHTTHANPTAQIVD